jgi:hypothetical protein
MTHGQKTIKSITLIYSQHVSLNIVYYQNTRRHAQQDSYLYSNVCIYINIAQYVIIPVQVRTGPEISTRLKFTDFKTIGT